jgi:hypothetical protein
VVSCSLILLSRSGMTAVEAAYSLFDGLTDVPEELRRRQNLFFEPGAEAVDEASGGEVLVSLSLRSFIRDRPLPMAKDERLRALWSIPCLSRTSQTVAASAFAVPSGSRQRR